jgi:superfamily II DNA or RNA helicase
MIATILTNKTIQLSNLTVWEEEIIDKRFSASRPNARFIDCSGGSAWDGIYHKFNIANKTLARPFLGELRALCKEKDLALAVQDKRPKTKYKPIDISLIDEDFLPGIKLKPFQIDAIKTIYRTEVGIINVTMGGGKGELITGICKALPCPTAIIAEQIQVIEQLKQRLHLRDVCSEPGLFYAGKMPNGQLIIIGSIQSLVKPKQKPEKPLQENFKDSKSGTAKKKFEKALKNYEIKIKAFRSRAKKAEALHKLIGACEMLLVDECVHEDTWIGTDLGVMPAKTLYNLVSSGVIVKAKVGSKTFPIIATHAKNGQAIEITTNVGRKLICSDNHPIATFDGFRRDAHAGDLQCGDLLLTSRGSINHKKHNINSRNKWYHLGLFIGDGHFLSNTSIRFAVRKDKKDWSNIAAAITNVWRGSILERENKRGDLTLRIKSEELCDWLKSLGFSPGRKMGYMHPGFVIPDTNAAINLIRGLLDSEGSGYRDKAIFGSIDLPIVQLIQSLLSYIGIGSSIYIGNKRTNKKHKTLYRLLIVGENFIKFRDRIGFGFARKQKRIETCYNNIKDSERYINYGQYVDRWLESGIKKHKLYSILGIKQIDHRNNVSLKRLIDWQNKINRFCQSVQINSYTDAKNQLGISYEKVSKHAGRTLIVTWYTIKKGDNQLWRNYTTSIIEKLKIPIVDVSLDSFAVEKVVSVKNSKKCRLIDFTVKNSESFEANGLLVHNCDLATSSTYKNLFKYWFKGRRRYGMTGTPYDADKPVENLVLQEHLGSVIYSQDRESVEKTGLIVPIEYFALAFGEGSNKDDASAFDIAVDEMMVHNDKFHRFIAALCKRFTDEGTLILVERDDLGYALQRLIPDSEFIHGKTSRKRRPEILQAFESRKLKVLIGGKNVRRGLDLKGGCENLILATGGKLASEFKQRVARAARINQKGSARIFDIYFLCNKYLYAHSRKRFKAAVAAGYVSKVIFRDGSVEGEKFIKSRFHRPKPKKTKDLPGQMKLF